MHVPSTLHPKYWVLFTNKKPASFYCTASVLPTEYPEVHFTTDIFFILSNFNGPGKLWSLSRFSSIWRIILTVPFLLQNFITYRIPKSRCRYRAGLLPIRCKTQNNQINQSSKSLADFSKFEAVRRPILISYHA